VKGRPESCLALKSRGLVRRRLARGVCPAINRYTGTVNLPTGSCAKTGRYPLALRGYTQFGDLAPRDHRLRTKRSIVR
jgi:hypothetical protein